MTGIPTPAASPAIQPTATDLTGSVLIRTLFTQGSYVDDTSTVEWVQGPAWFCDVRRPADFVRPRGTCLRRMERTDLAELARQEGFAGRLTDRAASGTIPAHVEWSHVVDLHPGAAVDAGTLEYGPDHLIERGVHADYLEHWTERARGDAEAHRLTDTENGADGVLVRVGDRFGWARGHPPRTIGRADPDAALRDAQDALDCEIALGDIVGDAWTITFSTLPFREGTRLDPRFHPGGATTANLDPDGAPYTRTWVAANQE
ncbi:hypothetical protein [Rhodococcus rhodnii]|uniref:Uncharacterized protein n=1 Tax=Rhodococcus rhodnii LMG 5362 TaxID=1273125 RepID=R7WMV0_9NOCA|nr:hypothetical protein [Rhodococcus rhodnii]EOM76628.1 hypothetical protein Rrhod_2025 [Rhodococcus rhodnii LMG 5362]